MSAVANPAQVLTYWFGDGADPWGNRSLWFGGGPSVDAEVRDRFGPTVEAALRGDLDGWVESADGTLALVLLLDQLPRNAFRGDPRSFEGDAMAQALALAALDAGRDRAWPSPRRMFLRMPLMHAEDADLQRRSLVEFGRLWTDDPDTADALDHAADHAAVVLRFGRFPDRNRLLGRASTPEEEAFLAHESRAWFEPQQAPLPPARSYL